jgi:inner membrane protein
MGLVRAAGRTGGGVATKNHVYMTTNLTVKGLIVGGMILLLLIPMLFISNLVGDRASRKEEVLKDVTSKWASTQTVTGPVLMVPFWSHYTSDDGKPMMVRKMAYFLPEHLRIKADLQPQMRYRSIYKVPVYESDMALEGDFNALPLSALQIAPQDLILSEAALCMGLGDLRGIEEPLEVDWNEHALPLNAGVPGNEVLTTGMSVTLPLGTGDLDSVHRFSIRLKLKGSDKLYFTPLGKTTEVSLSSPWPTPSFDGNFLPTDKSVTDKGFNAFWRVLYLNRNYPQYWVNAKYELEESAFGVNLFEATDVYSQTSRCVKYAILFIGLTFALYFFLEIFQEKRVHLMQYVLVGLALCIFYTLLLSVSEYLGFTMAYGIVGLATVLLIATYTGNVFKKTSVGWIFASMLAALYGFIYVLIRLEDGALLFGSIGLFVILALVMYYSKKVDWYKGAVLQKQTV